jgi:hypothetical protein
VSANQPTRQNRATTNELTAPVPDELSDAGDVESGGSEIPAQTIEDTKAAEEQVNGELQDKVEEESEAKDDDDAASTEDEGV